MAYINKNGCIIRSNKNRLNIEKNIASLEKILFFMESAIKKYPDILQERKNSGFFEKLLNGIAEDFGRSSVSSDERELEKQLKTALKKAKEDVYEIKEKLLKEGFPTTTEKVSNAYSHVRTATDFAKALRIQIDFFNSMK